MANSGYWDIWQFSDIGGIPPKLMFQRQYALKMANFRYWGFSIENNIYGCKALKTENFRYGGIHTRVMFYRQYYLKMANSDISDTLQKKYILWM